MKTLYARERRVLEETANSQGLTCVYAVQYKEGGQYHRGYVRGEGRRDLCDVLHRVLFGRA